MTMVAESETSTAPTSDERAPTPTRPLRSFSRTRYAGKLARREIRRRPWRAALVVLLVALPTWAMINVAIAVRTNSAEDDRNTDFAADLVVDVALSSLHAPVGTNPTESPTVADVEAKLPSGSVTESFFRVDTATMDTNGEVFAAELSDVDLTSAAVAQRWPIVAGAAPRSGEVALDVWLARDLGLGVGDTLALQHPAGEWRIAGLTGAGDYLLAIPGFDVEQVIAPYWMLLVDLPAATTQSEADSIAAEVNGWPPEGSRFSPDYDYLEGPGDAAAVALSWLAAVLVFTMFAVVIVAAFATVASSQLVLVGQLAANGARQRFIGRTLALQGFWAGLIGVTLGALAVIPTLGLLRAWLAGWRYAPVAHLTWHPLDVVVIALIGVGCATAAAVIPARALVRVSVLDALAGLRPKRHEPRWMVPVGLAAFAGGLLLLAVSLKSAGGSATLGAMLGTFSMVIAVCLIGPFVVRLAAKPAPRLPLVMRLSLRGLDRARLRSAAVVSSIAVTTGVAAVFFASVAANNRGPEPGDYAENVVVYEAPPALEVSDTDGRPLFDQNMNWIGEPTARVESVELSWVPYPEGEAWERIGQVLPKAVEEEFDVASLPDGVVDNSDEGFVLSAAATYESLGNSDEQVGNVADDIVGPLMAGPAFDAALYSPPKVANDALLRAYSLPASFDRDLAAAGYAIAVGPDPRPQCGGWSYDDAGPIPLWDGEPIEATADAVVGIAAFEPARIPVAGIACGVAAGPFLTAEFAAAHHITTRPGGRLFVNAAPLTDSERNALWGYDSQLVSSLVGWEYPPQQESTADAETETDPGGESATAFAAYYGGTGPYFYSPLISDADYTRYRNIFFAAALGMVGLITAIGLALAASDAVRDRAVLDVVGARPALQRRLVALDAWTLASLGALLGVPAGLFASWVVTGSMDWVNRTGVPWSFVAAVGVGVPLIVAGLAYLAGLLRRSSHIERSLQLE